MMIDANNAFAVRGKEVGSSLVQEHCPECKSQQFYRVKRPWWMRLLPGSRRYQCADCKTLFLIRYR